MPPEGSLLMRDVLKSETPGAEKQHAFGREGNDCPMDTTGVRQSAVPGIFCTERSRSMPPTKRARLHDYAYVV